MSTAEQDSGLQILPMGGQRPSVAGQTPRAKTKTWQSDPALATAQADAAAAGLWLNGDVLACACPECHGPMSIRLWLLVADCWICGTSIELSEEQERAAKKLIAAREKTVLAPEPGAKPDAKTSEVTAPSRSAPPLEKQTPPPPPKPVATARAKSPPPLPSKHVPASVVAPPAVPMRPAAPPGPATKAAIARRVAHDWLRDLPAWLVSLIFHIVAMLLLGLLTVAQSDRKGREIILAATMGKAGEEGGEKKLDEDLDSLVIKDPGPEQSLVPQVTEISPLDPIPLQIEPPQLTPPRPEMTSIDDRSARELPSMNQVRGALSSPDAPRMFEGRDPRVRTQMVLAEGGSMYTEAAVAQGLYWLHKHQADDGHWSLDHFHHHGNCNGRCGGQGDGHSDVGATALALLPFLGAGQTHTRGIYKDSVANGLQWLVQQQKDNGDLRGEGNGRMYAHGIASIALCEAYALTGDTAFKKPAQSAVNYIVKAQHRSSGRGTGGWRYDPGQPGDTSVVGWQLMALRSARIGELKVPETTFTQAGKFLDYVQHGRYGGLYSYQRGRGPDPAMIAEGLLCRQYLGWPKHHRGLHEGVNHLLSEHLPSKHDPNIYYWYYGTQVMHHLGGEAWEKWNNATREALVELQEREGHEAGSWSPAGGAIGGHDVNVGGRLYVTALAICTLEVYYRHLPIYRAIEIVGPE